MNDAISSHQGHGFEALLPFIVVDPDPQVVANAALKTAVLFRARSFGGTAIRGASYESSGASQTLRCDSRRVDAARR
jgi:hypothetical protein